jgi:uncharacterized membrane protein
MEKYDILPYDFRTMFVSNIFNDIVITLKISNMEEKEDKFKLGCFSILVIIFIIVALVTVSTNDIEALGIQILGICAIVIVYQILKKTGLISESRNNSNANTSYYDDADYSTSQSSSSKKGTFGCLMAILSILGILVLMGIAMSIATSSSGFNTAVGYCVFFIFLLYCGYNIIKFFGDH